MLYVTGPSTNCLELPGDFGSVMSFAVRLQCQNGSPPPTVEVRVKGCLEGVSQLINRQFDITLDIPAFNSQPYHQM